MMFLVNLNKLGTDAAQKRDRKMQASVFLAQLLGPMFVVFGIAFPTAMDRRGRYRDPRAS
jgi:hypothetical protein